LQTVASDISFVGRMIDTPKTINLIVLITLSMKYAMTGFVGWRGGLRIGCGIVGRQKGEHILFDDYETSP
jgi:hypothetical protein